MPRKSSRVVRLGTASTQATVPSDQPSPKHSTTNSRISPRKTAKSRGSYLPESKVLSIQQRHIRGENKTAIAKAEGVDRGTVARVVKFPEVREFIAQQQQEFFGLIPDAMETLRYALQVSKDAKVGLQILQATGVAPQPGERLQMPNATEDGEEHQARGLAAVILESHRAFRIELPPDMQRVLDLDESAHAAEKETEETRRPYFFRLPVTSTTFDGQ